MNGGMPPSAVKPPLMAPKNAPRAREIAKAKTAELAKSPPVTMEAATTEVSATMEPEDKSIPVVIMAKVTPIAMIPNIDTCSIILQTVRAEKNPSIETDNKRNNAIKINTIP